MVALLLRLDVIQVTELRGTGSKRLDANPPLISEETLNVYLNKGFAVSSEGFATEYPLHPQDVSLIRAVAEVIAGERTTIVVAPFVNALTIAFLVRVLAVATANRSKLCLYSADDSIRRDYRSLSYIANRVKEPMSKVHPLSRVWQRRRVTHCTTLKELTYLKEPAIVIVDARNTRGWRNLDPLPWTSITGPKVFLSLLDDNRLMSLLPDAQICYSGSCGRTVGDWPESFEGLSRKLDNYSMGIKFRAEPIPATDEPLAELERAFQNLHQKIREVPQAQMQLAQARRLNHFVQDSVLPLSFYQDAAHGLGRNTIEDMLRTVRGGTPHDAATPVRNAFYRFVRAADAAMDALSLRHPPKVGWFKKYILERKEPIAVPCSTHIEKLAFESWSKSTASQGCARVIPLTRADLRSQGYSMDVLATGPPSEEDLAYLLGGVSSTVDVLVYPWQARHWNILTRKASKLIAGVQPVPEPAVEGEYEESPEALDWTVLEKNRASEEELLRREFAEGGLERMVLIRTDAGSLKCDEDALVPTLEVDRFVDRPANLLRQGDVVIIQTGGNVIDASRTVDALAATNPVLGEAAQEANMWREILFTYIRSQNLSYKQIHDKLFPNNEVTFTAVRNWVLNRVKIGPHYDNLSLLLSRIGVSREKADEMARSVHRYRSFRFRVYGYLYRLWTNYASKLYELDEETSAEDEKIDAEFGLSLSSLEQLVTFAKVTETPILQEAVPRA